MCSEIDRLRRSVETLTEALEEKDAEIKDLKELNASNNSLELDLLLDSINNMASLYRTRFDTLPDRTQAVIRAYDRYIASIQREPQTSAV